MDTVLNKEKRDCCGCSACSFVCPVGAISMRKDDCGFMYPDVDGERCIQCGLCLRACSFSSDEGLQTPQSAYVAVAKDKTILTKSSSGGIFAAVARKCIQQGGAVFGCKMSKQEGEICVGHTMISLEDQIELLQGSKYVQSDMKEVFESLVSAAEQYSFILFSGTPCQVAAVKAFSERNRIENVVCIDIVCHGVPNLDWLNGYVREMQEKYKGDIQDIIFRDKSVAWGTFYSKIVYIAKGKRREKVIPSHSSSFYSLFLEGDSYRDSCYHCPYAREERAGDITIGDYWGIEAMHPDLLIQNGGTVDPGNGVSFIFCNTQKGLDLLESVREDIEVWPSEVSKIKENNKQLRKPSPDSPNRAELLRIYREKGYHGIEKWFRRKLGLKYYLYSAKNMIRNVKKSLNR